MYFSVVILAITLISCQAFVPDTVDMDLPIEMEMYANEKENGGLTGFLQKFKHTMQTGDSKTGVPKLDPFTQSQMSINNNELITVKGKLTNIRGAGMSNYHVKKADFSSSKLTADVSLLWDQISIAANYSVTGKSVDNTPFWGKGAVGIVIRDLQVTVNTKLAVKNGKMAVSTLSSQVHLNKFAFKITGLYDNEEKSMLATIKITNSMPKWIEDHQKEVSHISDRRITDMLNKYLQHFTLKDFLNMIKD